MEGTTGFRDVEAETERFMINLYKRRIREDRLAVNTLRGNWSEARAILRTHFGRVTRIAEQNQHKLVNLYRVAIDELRRKTY